MHHDSTAGCSSNGFVMSASRGTKGEVTWSTCSRNVAQSLDKDCLRDNDGGPSEWDHMDKYDNRPGKVEKILKGSHHLHFWWKFKLWAGKFAWGVKGKTLLGIVNKLLKAKSLLTTPSDVLPLYLKQTFPLIIWIFTEGEGDEMESRLPYRFFSTLII